MTIYNRIIIKNLDSLINWLFFLEKFVSIDKKYVLLFKKLVVIIKKIRK